MAGRPAAGGIEINTNSAHQLGLSWDLAGLSLAKTETNSCIIIMLGRPTTAIILHSMDHILISY